jgi:cytochrome c biogenesis protein CcmG, thiol:disulfide interchange protein DsbE
MVQEPEFLQEKPKNEGVSFFSPVTISLLVALLVFVVIMGIALFRQNQVQPLTGEVAPSFTIETYGGETIRSEDLRGQIVIINFWANWCAPCHVEAPALEQIQRDFADKGVVLIGMNWLDIESEAFSFIERYDLTYRNAPDTDEQMYRAFRVQGMPETFVIGRDGKIVQLYIGAVTYDGLAELLNTLLEGA